MTESHPGTSESLGRVAMLAYYTAQQAAQEVACGVKLLGGPRWEDLPQSERLAWSTAAVAVRNTCGSADGPRFREAQ